MALNTKYLIILPSAVVFCLFFLFQEGSAISCYKCNSKINSWCKDPFDNTTRNLEDCDEFKAKEKNHRHVKLYLTGGNWKDAPMYCRKIYQEVENDYRWIRGCAFLEDDSVKDREENDRCILRAGTKHIKYEACYCSKDKCNSGFTVQGSRAVFLIAALCVFFSL